MTEEVETIAIACMRPSEMKGPPTPGSTLEKCAECGVTIWSDPKIRNTARDRHGVEPKLICLKDAVQYEGFDEAVEVSIDLLREAYGLTD